MLKLPEHSEGGNACYLALGRALALATDYEENCRYLAHIFDVDSTESEFSYEVWKLLTSEDLNKKISRIVENPKLSGEVGEILHRGRKARNYIAHELAKNHRVILDKTSQRRAFLSLATQMVDDIAAANNLVVRVTRHLKGETNAEKLDDLAYAISVNSWVFDDVWPLN